MKTKNNIIFGIGFFCVILYNCTNEKAVIDDRPQDYHIVDSMKFGPFFQYIVNCQDTNWNKMYLYGVELLDRHALGSAVGFFYNISDTVKFQENGALPNSILKNQIGRMAYDSTQNTYLLCKLYYSILINDLVSLGCMYDKNLEFPPLE